MLVAIETLDIFGSQAIKLIQPVDSTAARLHAETRKTALLFSRFSIAIIRGNTVAIVIVRDY